MADAGEGPAAWIRTGATAISALIALSALAISCLARRKAAGAEKKAAEAQGKAVDALEKSANAQDRIATIENAREADRRLLKSRAVLRVTCERKTGGSFRRVVDGKPHITSDLYCVHVVNQGQAEARGVRVLFDGKVDKRIVWEAPQTDVIGHESEAIWKLGADPDTGRLPRKVEITWQDDSGIEGKFEVPLSF
jgi:hypothetical protein